MLRKIINQRFHITSVKIMHPMATHFIRLGIISTHILHSSINILLCLSKHLCLSESKYILHMLIKNAIQFFFFFVLLFPLKST